MGQGGRRDKPKRGEGVTEKTDRELLEEIHRSVAVCQGQRNPLLADVKANKDAIFGNGSTGLKARVAQHTWAIGLLGGVSLVLLAQVLAKFLA